MALNFGDIALAIAEGGAKGAVKVQEAREKKLSERIKELQKNDVELAKSRHKTAYKSYETRKTQFDPIMSAGDMYTRNMVYNTKVLGLSEEQAAKKASESPLDLSDDFINNAIGDEPLFDYKGTDYSGVEAQSVLGDLGIGETGPTVEEQVSAIRASGTSAAQKAPQIKPQAYTGTLEQPEWSKVKDKEKDMRGTLLKKYDDALEIAKRQNIENPEEFAFNIVKADKENKDLRGTTRKKFDDLVDIKVNEMKIEPTVARAEALAEVLREEKDNRSAFQKKFDEKVELYMSIKELDKTTAKKLALADIEQENAINRDIVVPTIMAISRGEKVPAAQMAAFQAYNVSKGNFFTQALSLGGEGLQQFVAQPGETPSPQPTPSPTVEEKPKAMPVEQALAILREKATPEMVQYFIDTYGEDKLPPELKQQ